MPVKLADKRRSYANYLGFVDAESGVPAKPANTIAPALTGTATVGSVLTVDDGTWTGNPLPTFAYRWFADGVMIPGAFAATYTIAPEQAGAVITAKVFGSSQVGSAVAESNATAAVTMAPQNDALPVITGTAQEGEELTTTDGEWTASPVATYAYAWQRSGTPIAAATGATYTLVADDVGEVITVKVTATNSAGATVAESDPTDAVIAAA